VGNTYLSGYDAAGNPIYATAEPATRAEMDLDAATQRGLNLDALHALGANTTAVSGASDTANLASDQAGGNAITNALSGIIGWVDKNVPVLGAADSAVGLNPNTPGSGLAGTAASIKSGLSFITDIPRVATTLLGLILIIAGIFALSKGPAVQIVGSAVKDAVTS